MKDVEYKRTNNAIAEHMIETGLSINGQNIKRIEKQTRTIARKLLEGCYIRSYRDICMNRNDGAHTSARYGEGGGVRAWLRRENIKRDSKATLSSA